MNAAEAGGQLNLTEAGWTGGQNGVSKQPKCAVPFSAGMPLEVGGTSEQAITFGGDETEEGGHTVLEPYLARFGTGVGAEACGHVEVTSPTITVGNVSNAQEVPVGKPATLGSKVEGADALAASWKFIRKGTGGKVESEETRSSTEYLGEATTLPYTFTHTGEYEIIETVTTDNLGVPTKQVVRKVTAVLPPITFQGRSERRTSCGWRRARNADRIPRESNRPQRNRTPPHPHLELR